MQRNRKCCIIKRQGAGNAQNEKGRKSMKRLTCAVVGYGDRGGIYCRYALEKPEELELIAAVDPSEVKRKEAQKKYSLKDEALFASLEEFLESGIKCDFVINATMD